MASNESPSAGGGVEQNADAANANAAPQRKEHKKPHELIPQHVKDRDKIEVCVSVCEGYAQRSKCSAFLGAAVDPVVNSREF